MDSFRDSELMVILQIPHNAERDDLAKSIQMAFDQEVDAVRLGIRYIDGRYVIVSSEWSDKESHDAVSHPMYLNELLQLFPGRLFNLLFVEDETDHVAEYADLLTLTNSRNRVLSSALYGKTAVMLKKVLPDADLAYPFMNVVGLYALYRSGLIHFKRKFAYTIVQTYESVGPSYMANQGFIRILKKRGVSVHVIAEENDDTVRRLVNAGVNGFIIKRPEYAHRLKELL